MGKTLIIEAVQCSYVGDSMAQKVTFRDNLE